FQAKPKSADQSNKAGKSLKAKAKLAKGSSGNGVSKKRRHWKQPPSDRGVDEALALSVDAKSVAKQLRSTDRPPSRATLRLATACLMQCVRHVNKEPRAFNSIVRACLRHWVRAADSVLGRTANDNDAGDEQERDDEDEDAGLRTPSSYPRWEKIRVTCKQYLNCVLLLLDKLRDQEAVRAIAQHCLPLLPYFLCLPRTLKPLLKSLISRWSQGPAPITVLAFLACHRVVKSRKSLCEQACKWMLAGYLQSARLGDSALAVLQQRTLCEMLLLQPNLAYKLAFVHLRQCAAALGRESQQGGTGEKSGRKTKTTKSSSGSLLHKAPLYAGLWLWTRLVAASDELTSLVYPLTQILEALCRTLAAARHLPLRVHCLRMLLHLTRQTGAATALLPGALALLDLADFNKGVASRALSLEGITKLSQSQLKSPSFRAAVSDVAYELLAGWVRSACQLTAFPELCLPLTRRLKRLAKDCRCRAVAKPAAQLLRLTMEAASWTRQQRATVRPIGGGNDVGGIQEADRLNGRSPFQAYYLRYRSMRREELARARPGDDQEVNGEDEDKEENGEKEPMEVAELQDEEEEPELSDLPSTDEEDETGDYEED
uniref:Nucleolar complex protein 2 homolog n=2 Tax=Macrostomum lignano TaxID=282301 RepID=A0A1I8J7K2_9PLAT